MKLPIYQVDAFTGRLFAGNPAAVVFLKSEISLYHMQAVAGENNLAETAFILTDAQHYNIRWFTPVVEVSLCGHATLASAHVIFNHLGICDDKISFFSKSGFLYVRKAGDVLYLDFPADFIDEAELTDELIGGLGIEPLLLYKGRDDYLAIFNDEETIRAITPDMTKLSNVSSRGVIVSAPGRDGDFVSRFFAPQSGIPEDPVTGSAHTTLIPYWSKKLGKKHLKARQISKRGGELFCTDMGERVEIGGKAVTYLEGQISVPDNGRKGV